MNSDAPAQFGGLRLFLPFSSNISIDSSHLPYKLIVVINHNTWSVLQFMVFSGCVPGCLAVMTGSVGSVDEIHFDRTDSSPDVVMVRKRRSFCSVKVEQPVTVVKVGAEDDAENPPAAAEGGEKKDLLAEESILASGAGGDAGLVINGQTNGKVREVQLLVNGERLITGWWRRRGTRAPSSRHSARCRCCSRNSFGSRSTRRICYRTSA